MKKAVLKGPRCYSRETQLIIMPRVPRGAGCSAIDRVTRSVTHTQQQQKHISLSHFQDSFFLFHSPPFITAQFRSGIVDWEEVEATKEKKKKEMLVHCSISNPTKSKQRRLEFNKRKKGFEMNGQRRPVIEVGEQRQNVNVFLMICELSSSVASSKTERNSSHLCVH